MNETIEAKIKQGEEALVALFALLMVADPLARTLASDLRLGAVIGDGRQADAKCFVRVFRTIMDGPLGSVLRKQWEGEQEDDSRN